MEPIDIMLVTFKNFEDVRTVIELIYRNTESPFRLLIADNGGEKDILDYLHRLAQEKNNVVIVQNPENLYCCRASNQLLALWNSRYGFYLCSYECFVVKKGWDTACIRAMDAHPKTAIGGYLSWSKYYVTGADYMKNDFFAEFRNPQYARENPHKEFKHVQGGFFVLRKAAYDAVGGFNENLTHGHMDVEYSYYLESMGWELLSLDHVLSLHRTTRPNLEAFDLSQYSVIHPLGLEKCKTLGMEFCLPPVP